MARMVGTAPDTVMVAVEGMPDMVVMATVATAEKEAHREATEVMAEMVLATETEVMAGTEAKEVTGGTVEKGAPTEDITAKMEKMADTPFTITSVARTAGSALAASPVALG